MGEVASLPATPGLAPLTPVAPGPLPNVASSRPDSYRASRLATVANVVLGVDLVLIGLSMLYGLLVGLSILASPDSELAATQHETYAAGITSWSTRFWNFVLVGGIPLLWILATRREAWTGTRLYLGVRSPLRSAAVGVGLSGWFVGPVLLLSYLVSAGGGDDWGAAARLAATPTVVLLGSAALAGLGEELLFRGLLYRWVGWWAQGLLFCFAHFGNGEPLQLGIALTIGLVFGWLRRAGWSLVALATAHAAYDASLMLVAKFAS